MKEFLHRCMDAAPALTIMAVIGLLVAAVIGWILNVAKLFAVSWITGEAIVRVIGVFMMPLGAVAGYF